MSANHFRSLDMSFFLNLHFGCIELCSTFKYSIQSFQDHNIIEVCGCAHYYQWMVLPRINNFTLHNPHSLLIKSVNKTLEVHSTNKIRGSIIFRKTLYHKVIDIFQVWLNINYIIIKYIRNGNLCGIICTNKRWS